LAKGQAETGGKKKGKIGERGKQKGRRLRTKAKEKNTTKKTKGFGSTKGEA